MAACGNNRMPTPTRPIDGFNGALDQVQSTTTTCLTSNPRQELMGNPPTATTKILINGHSMDEGNLDDFLPPPALLTGETFDSEQQHSNTNDGHGLLDRRRSTEALRVDTAQLSAPEPLEQTAEFFDPQNTRAAQIREQVAQETLDELLDFILEQGGSVGIFDATNSTLERRKSIMKRIRERAGPDTCLRSLEPLGHSRVTADGGLSTELAPDVWR